MVVAQPDAAVPVAANDAGTAVQQGAPAGAQVGKGLPGSAGHAAAVQIVHPVVPHLLPGQVVVEAGVVGRAVHQAHGTAHYLAEELFLLQVVFFTQLCHAVQKCPEPLRGVEQRGFVHIVPEALNAAVGQHLVAVAEPVPHFRAQKIGKIGLAGPHGSHKGGAVGFGAEIPLLQPLGAGGVLRVDAHARVDDGHQPDALLLQLGTQRSQIREALLVHRKIRVPLHIVDVQADHVQRQLVLAVLAGDGAHVLGSLVAPAALGKTKGPFGRDVAVADQLPEFGADGVRAVAGQDVQVVVRLFGAEGQPVVPGVADIVEHLSREIHEHAKDAAARTAVDEQKIVRSIVRKPVFSVVRLVGVVGHIMPAALVDAAGHLAQAVHHGILCQREAPAPVWFCGEVRHCGGGRLHRQHDALGGQRAAKGKTLDHGKNSLSPKNQKPFCTFILRQALPENKRQNRHVFATKPS